MATLVLGNTVIKHPYTARDLRTDNPFTRYRDVSDLPAIFAATEKAKEGYEVVEPALSPRPGGDVVEEAMPMLVGGVWTQQWRTRSFTHAEWKDRIAIRRYQEEVKGITVGGSFIKTDRESQSKVIGAALATLITPGKTRNWKAGNGFVQIDDNSVVAVAKALDDHVQACFDREAELVAAVDGGTFTSDMLDKGWP